MHSCKLKQSKIVIDGILYSLTDLLSKGDKVKFIGFGEFSVGNQSARVSTNFNTGEKIHVPAKKAVKFKAGIPLKRSVNGV